MQILVDTMDAVTEAHHAFVRRSPGRSFKRNACELLTRLAILAILVLQTVDLLHCQVERP